MSMSVYAYCYECEPLFDSDDLNRIYAEYGKEYTIKTGDVLIYPLSDSSNFEVHFPYSEYEDCYLDTKLPLLILTLSYFISSFLNNERIRFCLVLLLLLAVGLCLCIS